MDQVACSWDVCPMCVKSMCATSVLFNSQLFIVCLHMVVFMGSGEFNKSFNFGSID